MKKQELNKLKRQGNLIFIILAVALFFGQAANAAEKKKKVSGRPKIMNNTLTASDGERLRGGTFWLYGWIPDKTTWALSDEPWSVMKKNGFNIVRVACAYRPSKAKNYSLDQFETYLDQIITRAEKMGIDVIVDFHPTPGTYNLNEARDFWNRFAPRYKNRKNVIYELVNEPVFSQPENYSQQNLRDFEELYKISDRQAPKTPVILMTFNAVGKTGRTPKQITDGLKGINWKKTVVGFHSYWCDSSERIKELKKYYPCFNTEFTKVVPKSKELQVMDGYRWHGSLMETLGISWTQWNILDNPSGLHNLDSTLVDLKTRGLYWVK